MNVAMCFFFFFFQAEDGIRDVAVTGVQTCALPIFNGIAVGTAQLSVEGDISTVSPSTIAVISGAGVQLQDNFASAGINPRSEERRVGKECRSRWSPYH